MQLWSGIQSREWPSTTGEVVSSEARYSAGKGHRYSLVVDYRYRVADLSYRSSRVRAVAHNGTKEEIEARVQALRPGSAVVVYYDPMKPSVAYLEKGVAAVEFLLLVIGLVLVVISSAAIKAIMMKKADPVGTDNSGASPLRV